MSKAAAQAIKRQIRSVLEGKENEKQVVLMVPDPEDIFHLKGILIAPLGSPIEGFIYFLSVCIPADYPFSPPRIAFSTKVYNPKINPIGGICLPELRKEHWRVIFTLETLLVSIQRMLVDPEVADPSNALVRDIAQIYLRDRDLYNKTAKDWAHKHNDGFGPVVFEDLRISAIQSALRVPGVIQYEASVFCQKTSNRTWKLTLVVAPQLTLYRHGIEQLYCHPYTKITGFSFDYDEEDIVLDIGEGTSLDQCWKIALGPLNVLNIRKSDVDSFVPGRNTPPVCELELSWLRKEREPLRLIHKLSVKGAKPPLCSFDICVDPKAYPGIHSEEERPKLPELLKFRVVDNRENICILTEVGTNYFNFGVFLLNDHTGSITSNIVQRMRENAEDINREILIQWLNDHGKQPVTWTTLAQSLNDTGLTRLAADIKTAKGLR